MERAISGERSVSAPNRIKLIEFKDGEDDFFPSLSSSFSFDPSVSFGTCVGGVSPLHVAKLR